MGGGVYRNARPCKWSGVDWAGLGPRRRRGAWLVERIIRRRARRVRSMRYWVRGRVEGVHAIDAGCKPVGLRLPPSISLFPFCQGPPSTQPFLLSFAPTTNYLNGQYLPRYLPTFLSHLPLFSASIHPSINPLPHSNSNSNAGCL